MDELSELRDLLQAGRIEDALLLVDELDEMSREDKINKISRLQLKIHRTFFFIGYLLVI